MKTLVKSGIIASLLLLISTETIFAQGPPSWAPAHGYRSQTRHIYFPQHNVYYDMNRQSYLYLNGRNWTVSASVPSIYVGINFGRAAQVELNYGGNDPYRYNQVHVVEYRQYCDGGHHKHHHKHHGKKQKKHHKHHR
jgi:hypothetical protein